MCNRHVQRLPDTLHKQSRTRSVASMGLLFGVMCGAIL